MNNNPLLCGPGNRARAYHTVSPLADNLESVDIDILVAGDAGDTWTLITMNVPVRYVVQDGDTPAEVAAALRLGADAIGGVTASGLTSHVILTRDAAVTVHAPQLFESINSCGDGEAEVTVLDTEQVSGRGELRIVQSVDDPTPLDAPESPDAIDLGTSEAFAILTKAGITSAGTEDITGDMGVSPAAAASITGFGLVLDGSGEFSTSAEVTGQVFAADYAAPTPAMLTAAVADMEAAYTDASGRTPDTTELAAGLIGGLTLVPGVYKWTTGVTIASDLTFQGGAGDRWILIISGTLDLAAATDIILAGGALPENIVWAVAGATSLLATSHFEGVLLSQTSVAMGAGATLDGRLLAQTAVTLDSNTIVQP